MFRINHLSLPWKALVAHAEESLGDGGLDAVAKSLLINPSEPEEEDSEATEESDAPSDALPEDTSEDTPDDKSASDEESEESDDASGEPVDIDDVEIEVTVDGETKSVKLGELKARYSGEAAIDSRLQEASEIKTKVIQTGTVLYKTLNEQAARLQYLDSLIQQNMPQNINWEELRVKDPGKYLLERERVREMEDQRRQLAHENSVIQQRQAELNAMALHEYATEQTKEVLRRVPELRDRNTAQEIMGDLASASQYYGFSQEELASVIDHRHLMVLVDAARYRKHVASMANNAENKKVQMLKARPLLKAGTNSQKATAMSNAKKEQLNALKRAKSTGHVDDIAKLLLVRKK